MSDTRLRRALAKAPIPKPDPQQRQRAIDNAVQTFKAHQKKSFSHQGLALWQRLMNTLSQSRNSIMDKKWIYTGISASLIIGLAAYIGLNTWQTPSLPPVDSRPEPLQSADKNLHLAPSSNEIQPMLEASRPAMAKMGSLKSKLAAPVPALPPNRDRFQSFTQNTLQKVADNPVSTFSIDVDTAAYAYVRRLLKQGQRPPVDAVRTEEFINYFHYDYPPPQTPNPPFNTWVSVFPAPWNTDKKLIHIGIKGYEPPATKRPPAHLVFLLDVSGSMSGPDRLPLLIRAMKLLVEQLHPDDKVAIVVYAGAVGTVLEPTSVKQKQKILAALERLHAGGSTAGGAGIQAAYRLASSMYDPKAINRVILATDGDFNVGIHDPEQLQAWIAKKRETGIFLSVLGFGQGNLNDRLMQALAQNGNGIAAYIDNFNEARKVLVEQINGTLLTIAQDVKIQVEFNPTRVAEYRLLGYETRTLNADDFNNDAVDAGDIGAGHSVTALYEIVPVDSPARLIEPSRYQSEPPAPSNHADEYAFLKIRYKLPGETQSKRIERIISKQDELGANTPPWLTRESYWASAVAAFAEKLKGGKYLGSFDYAAIIALARANKGPDAYGYRAEFLQLVETARAIEKM